MTDVPPTLPPVDPDLQSHYVTEVRITAEQVRVVCSCGWENPSRHQSETDAREEWEEHAK